MRMQVDGSRQHQFLTRVDLAFGPTDLSDGRNATALDPDVDLTDPVRHDGGTATNG